MDGGHRRWARPVVDEALDTLLATGEWDILLVDEEVDAWPQALARLQDAAVQHVSTALARTDDAVPEFVKDNLFDRFGLWPDGLADSDLQEAWRSFLQEAKRFRKRTGLRRDSVRVQPASDPLTQEAFSPESPSSKVPPVRLFWEQKHVFIEVVTEATYNPSRPYRAYWLAVTDTERLTLIDRRLAFTGAWTRALAGDVLALALSWRQLCLVIDACRYQRDMRVGHDGYPRFPTSFRGRLNPPPMS